MKSKETSFKSDKGVAAIIGPAASGKRKAVLFCGCVASGKTSLCRNIARSFATVNYFDKDSMAVIAAAGAVRDRSLPEFSKFREAEMEACVNLILESLEFCPLVVMSAPWRLELCSLFENKPHERIRRLADGCHQLGAKLCVVFIDIPKEILHEHLRKRAACDPDAASRTESIFSDPDKPESFLATQLLHVPDGVTSLPDVDCFHVFDAGHAAESFESIKKALEVDFDLPHDPDF